MPPCGGRAASLNRLKPQMSRTRPYQQLWKTPRGWGVTGHGAAGVLSLNAPHANYAAAGDEFANQDGDAVVCQLTHAHSKKIENHRQALGRYFICDNLARIHSTLRRHCVIRSLLSLVRKIVALIDRRRVAPQFTEYGAGVAADQFGYLTQGSSLSLEQRQPVSFLFGQVLLELGHLAS